MRRWCSSTPARTSRWSNGPPPSKSCLYLTLLVDLFMPVGIATSAAPVAVLVAIVAWVGKVFVLAIAVTVVESTNAKLRLFRVPELVSISLGLAFLALAIRFL